MSEKVTAYEIKAALAEKHRKDFFMTECKDGPTWTGSELRILDGLAIKKSWANPCFTGYEVKVSRGDFLRDSKFYTYSELVNRLYIVCPKGMIDRTELPESVGLMYYNANARTLITKKAAIHRAIEYSADMLMYIIFSKLDSDRTPFFSSKVEFLEAWLKNKKSDKMLGCEVGSALAKRISEKDAELRDLWRFKEDHDEYDAIIKVLDAYHIWKWGGGYAASLEKALSRRIPADIKDIRESLERTVAMLKRTEEVEANI